MPPLAFYEAGSCVRTTHDIRASRIVIVNIYTCLLYAGTLTSPRVDC